MTSLLSPFVKPLLLPLSRACTIPWLQKTLTRPVRSFWKQRMDHLITSFTMLAWFQLELSVITSSRRSMCSPHLSSHLVTSVQHILAIPPLFTSPYLVLSAQPIRPPIFHCTLVTSHTRRLTRFIFFLPGGYLLGRLRSDLQKLAGDPK